MFLNHKFHYQTVDDLLKLRNILPLTAREFITNTKLTSSAICIYPMLNYSWCLTACEVMSSPEVLYRYWFYNTHTASNVTIDDNVGMQIHDQSLKRKLINYMCYPLFSFVVSHIVTHTVYCDGCTSEAYITPRRWTLKLPIIIRHCISKIVTGNKYFVQLQVHES